MISVIICSYNPRPDYLGRTLAGLRAQTLPTAEWELLLIDNRSDPALAPDLSWHPAARCLREEEVGLTAARLRGIAEATGELMVWVDDDNILAPDYLAVVAQQNRVWPMLGVWGCGSYTPEWEETPKPEFAPYLAFLAVHQAAANRWSNRAYDHPATPAGAGLCTRRAVALQYADNVRHDPRRKLLGRVGGQLSACEDFDFALTAIDLGFGTGVFRELAMIHLMPRGRVAEEYLLRLVEGHAYSTVLLMALRDPGFAPKPTGFISTLRERRYRRSLAGVDLQLYLARRRGEERAWQALGQLPR